MEGGDMLLAMDEFLRYYPPAYLGRLILEDVEIEGVKMKAGQHVLLHQQTANRDRSLFEDPDTIHLDRSPNRHLGLGLGVHRCLGAHLVRNEGQIVAEAFLKRIPEFELDESKPPSWIPGQVSGMANVHLKFPAGKRLDGKPLAEAL
jgi:cytochrome P450